MCRILIARLTRPNVELIDDLFGAFINASKHDPYLLKVTRGATASHSDGWGLIAVGAIDGTLSIVEYRSPYPVFSNAVSEIIELIKSKISMFEEVYLLIHSRKASRGEPYGTDYLHPFFRLSERGALWFAHNGGASKKELAELLGVHYWLNVDSGLLGQYLMSKVMECYESGRGIDDCVKASYMDARRYVRGLYNTGLLGVLDERPVLYTSHAVYGGDPELAAYGELISYRLESGLIVASITFKEYFETEATYTTLRPGLYKFEEELHQLAEL